MIKEKIARLANRIRKFVFGAHEWEFENYTPISDIMPPPPPRPSHITPFKSVSGRLEFDVSRLNDEEILELKKLVGEDNLFVRKQEMRELVKRKNFLSP